MKISKIAVITVLSSFMFSGLCQADAASGLPTGKRQHKPVTIVKPVDKSTPLLMKSVTQPGKSGDQKGRAAYRLCPDGTMIHPGEKCPEKSAKTVR